MYTASIAVDSVIDALKVFLTPFIPGGQVIRGQVNRVPMPAAPCAVLTELLDVDLCVPYDIYDPVANTDTIMGPTRIDIQIDFYGDSASEYCKSTQSAFRSAWGFRQFPANIRPLYTSDGLQNPLISGEQQWSSRWTLTVSLQYNPSVTVPQDFADVATPKTPVAVDVVYP